MTDASTQARTAANAAPRQKRVQRAEIFREIRESDGELALVRKPLRWWEMLYNQEWLRKSILLILLGLAWELEARHLDNDLLIPTLGDTLTALYADTINGVLPLRVLTSLKLLVMGYAAGTVLAVLLTVLAISTRAGQDLLETLTAMMNPLPAIALLPLAMIWFGLGSGSIIFVLIHSVMWAVSLNMYSGFRAVSPTLRMVGRNYGLGGLGFVGRVLIPGAFPSILAGLKIGWAFGWRTLIAAELVFGVSSGGGGLGWYIFEHKNSLDIPEVFAGLLSIIIIGLVVEYVIFRAVEQATVVRWGLSS